MKQSRYIVVAAVALALAACDKKEEPAKAAAPAPAKPAASTVQAPSPVQTYTQAPPSAAVPQSSVTVRNVTLGTAIGPDKKVTQRANTASARDPLFVSFDLYGAGEANVKVRWSLKGGSAAVKEDVSKFNVTQPSTLAFARPDTFTPGEYDVEVVVNEVSMGKFPFTLQ